MDPALLRPFFWKARALECMEEVEEAMETYQEVLVMEPGCEEAVDRITIFEDDKNEVIPALQEIIAVVLDDGAKTDELAKELLHVYEMKSTVKAWISAEVEEAEKLSEKLCHMVYRQHGQDR